MGRISRENASAVEAFLIGTGSLIAIAAVIWWAMASAHFETNRVPPVPKQVGGGSRLAGFVGDQAWPSVMPASSHSTSGPDTRRRSTSPGRPTWPAGSTAGRSRTPSSRRFPGPTLSGITGSASSAEGGEVEKFLLDYAFGSGSHASTFVSMTDRDPHQPAGQEHRLTCYTGTETNTLDVTPGHELMAHADGTTPRGRSLSSLKLHRCFRCHTTATSAESRELLDVATMIPNVNCERCHGPAKAHVEAARRGESELGSRRVPNAGPRTA